MGCRTDSQRYGLHELGVSREQVRRIEPLELKRAEPNDVPPAVPEPPAQIELSLAESRALALENNLQLRTALISPAIAAAQLGAEEAKFEASFFANANVLRTDQPQGRAVFIDGLLVPTVTASQIERLQADLGLRMPLRTGGTVAFSLADTRT
ncbi:MAG: hypothetical protein FJ280_31355, partial [Planctomycetes bacterium]|nr:hypothetical protein [Planctomycetota bacterium]